MRVPSRALMIVLAWAGAARSACAAAGGMSPEEALQLARARSRAQACARRLNELQAARSQAERDLGERIARLKAYRAALSKKREELLRSRAAAADIELIERGIAQLDAAMLNMRALKSSLQRQIEFVKAQGEEAARLAALLERLQTLPQAAAQAALNELPRYERDAAQAAARLEAKRRAKEAAAVSLQNAKAKTANAEAAFQKARESLNRLQAALSAEKRKSQDWKRKYLLGALKLPIKVVKAPLDMLDSVGEETPKTSKLGLEDLLLLRRCRVARDESAWSLAAQQAAEAEAAFELAALQCERAEAALRISKGMVDALRDRAAAAKRERMKAAARRASEQAAIQKKHAEKTAAALEARRKEAQARRDQIAAEKPRAADYAASLVLDMKLRAADETLALLALQKEAVEAEAALKADEARLAELVNRLALSLEAKTSREELLREQRRLELERKQAREDQTALKSHKLDAEAIVNSVREKARDALAFCAAEVPNEPSRADVEMAQLTTDAERAAYREALAAYRRAIDRQLQTAKKIVEIYATRLKTNERRVAALARAQAALAARRAAALWARGEVGISLTALKHAAKTFRRGYSAALNFGKNYEDILQSWLDHIGKARAARMGLQALAALAAAFLLRWALRWLLRRWRRSLREKFQGRVSGRLRLMLPYVIGRSLSVLLFCGLLAAGAGAFAPSAAAQATLLDAALLLGAFRLLHAISSAAFSPHRGDRRLVRWNEHLTGHIHLVIGLLLLLTAAAAFATQTVRHFQPDPDASAEWIALIWSLYKLALVVLAIVFLSHPLFISKLMPQADTWAGKLVRLAVIILYPVSACFAVLILAVWLAGYRVMAAALIKALLQSVAIMVVSYVLARTLIRRLRRRRSCKAPQNGEARSAWTCEHAVTLLIAAGAAAAIAALWKWRFGEAVTCDAAPDIVKAFFSHLQRAWEQCADWVRTYQIPLGENKSTRPIKLLSGFAVAAVGLFAVTLARRAADRTFFSKPSQRTGAWHTIRACVYYALVALICLYGLTVAGVPLSALTIFAGAFGIGIGFGMQNIISNFISGIIILFERPIKPQDFIDVDEGLSGWVKRIGTRSTTIETRDRINVIVPNSKFIESTVVNWHGRDPKTRVHVPVGVAYGSDVPKVKECLLQVARNEPDVEDVPAPDVWFIDFGESSLDFELLVWIRDPSIIPQVASKLRYAIDAAFRRNGIEIPFPQRDVHVRSSVPLPHVAQPPPRPEGDDG